MNKNMKASGSKKGMYTSVGSDDKEILKKIVFFSIIVLILLFQPVIKAQNDEKNIISGEINYEDELISMRPGETSTITFQIKNNGISIADFIIHVSGDGKYLYFNFNPDKKAVDHINPLYGSVISPAPITLNPDEIKRVRFTVLAQKPCSRNIPVNITLYGAKFGTIEFREIDKVSISAHISSSPLQDKLNYNTLLLIFSLIFIICSLIALYHGLKKKDVFLLLVLFFVSILIRAFSLETVSTYPADVLYPLGAKALLINQWRAPEIILNQPSPFSFYLVGIFIHFFGEQIEILKTVSIISGALTVCLTYLLGKSLFNRRVGVISALFLCFCNYHILYSRVLMFDSLSLLFVFSTIYLFWRGYCEDKGEINFYLAGFMLGFGTLIKFTSLLVIPVIILFVLWTKKSIRALFERKLIILCTIAFLTMLPYLFYLYVNDVNPFYLNLVERLKIAGPSKIRCESTLFGYIERIVSEYTLTLTNGDYMIPWSPIFKLSALLLFPIVMIYHLYLFIKRHMNSNIILVFYFVSLCFFILFISSKHRYYLLYLLPCYFILLSSLIIDCITHINYRILSDTKQHIILIIAFILILSSIFGLSYAVIGTLTPVLEKGEFNSIEASILKIKNHLHPNDPEVMVGTAIFFTSGGGGETHYLIGDYCNSHNMKVMLISLFMREEKPYGEQRYGIDLNKLKELEPKYLIVDNFVLHYCTTVEVREELMKNYSALKFSESEISNPNVYPFVVYKRKD